MCPFLISDEFLFPSRKKPSFLTGDTLLMATTWYERHQRSRAAVDAKQKAFVRNQVEATHLRDASWESQSQMKVTKADIKRRIAKRKEAVFEALRMCVPNPSRVIFI